MDKINILNSLSDAKKSGFKLSKAITTDVVAGIVDNSMSVGYVLKGGNERIEQIAHNSNKSFCPYISLSVERNVIVITGDSGVGKTLIASILIEEHKKHFCNDYIYFISGNNVSDDENLRNLKYISQLDIEGLEEYKAEDFEASLVVVDDCDYNKNNKIIMQLLNDLVERGRKFNVSVIFISHLNSRLNKSVIYRDYNIYITFQDNLINNRMLEFTLKIQPQMLKQLKDLTPSFICFNKTFRCVITNKYIISF